MKLVDKLYNRVLSPLLPTGARGAVLLFRNPQSALVESGWFRSFETGLPVDAEGKPIPWMSYPFINFIEPRLRRDMKVFEFGMGNSTLWWSGRVQSVDSCEHDKDWFKRISADLPSNVYAVLKEQTSTEYVCAAAQPLKRFHIICIDGRRRVRCAINSVSALSDDGVIIWDNTERAYYIPGFNHLEQHEFRRIDFWGMVAGSPRKTCTTIFYRKNNCLGI